MHASAVLFGGECLVFTGAAGSGKSTRVARHILQGGTLVADDFLHITAKEITPPPTIAGVLALRDYGLLKLPFSATAAPQRFIVCDQHTAPDFSEHEWRALCAMGELLPEDWIPKRQKYLVRRKEKHGKKTS